MDITFTASFDPIDVEQAAPLPPSTKPNDMDERIRSAVTGKLKETAAVPTIMQDATVDSANGTIQYAFVQPQPSRRDDQREMTYLLRDGMIYEKLCFSEEWKRGAKTTLMWLGVLIDKVVLPVILSLPFIYYFLSKERREKVDRAYDTCDREFCAMVVHLALAVLWILTGGLLSYYTNMWNADVERWANGHWNVVDTMGRRERIKAKEYFMPCRQPIARLTNVSHIPSGPIDISTTTLISDGQKKAIMEHILSQRIVVAHKPWIYRQAAPEPVVDRATSSRLFPENFPPEEAPTSCC